MIWISLNDDRILIYPRHNVTNILDDRDKEKMVHGGDEKGFLLEHVDHETRICYGCSGISAWRDLVVELEGNGKTTGRSEDMVCSFGRRKRFRAKRSREKEVFLFGEDEVTKCFAEK